MKIPLTKQTVVNCKTWDRASRNKPQESKLLTAQGKRCCLGFAAKQSGVTDKDLLNLGTPSNISANAHIEITKLAGAPNSPSSSIWAEKAMCINDDDETNTHEKIAELRKHWKKLGRSYSVKFINIPLKKKKK